MEELQFPYRGMLLLAHFINEVAKIMIAAPLSGAYIQAAGWLSPETIHYMRLFLEEQEAAKIDPSVINKLKDLESE